MGRALFSLNVDYFLVVALNTQAKTATLQPYLPSQNLVKKMTC